MRFALVFVAATAVLFFVIVALTADAATHIPTVLDECAAVQLRGSSQTCR